VSKQNSKWYATPVNYQPDSDKIERLTQIRRQEQDKMREYMGEKQQCLMAFLAKELDDPNPTKCGKCAVCLGESLLPETPSLEIVNQAIQYLRRCDIIIQPRKRWPSEALPTYGFSGNIKPNLIAEAGRALSLWGDAGWGELVKLGKYRDNNFNDVLVEGAFEMIQRWQPELFPTWVTCVPSLNRPELVPNFARKLADRLNLPFQPVIRKIRQTPPQKEMNNSYQQAHNLDGAFAIDTWEGIKGTVFLVDDMVDSRWTFTVIAALLRQGGSGSVFPLALSLNSLAD
jgi:ATP-dependent DNA helicase RecQ